MRILVTGAAGYIGSHVCLELLQNGFDVIAVDNLSNSKRDSLDRVEELTGKRLKFFELDIREKEKLIGILATRPVDAVIHLAGLKAVGESVSVPLKYYQNNISGTLSLCEAMRACDVKKMVFSSSATVYGDPLTLPIREDFPLSAKNPYGRSKLMIEQILEDIHHSDNRWNFVILRYFNPVGAHPSGRIGEDPNGIPNNLFPVISQVAMKKLAKLEIFGGDYPTPDGTGIRDYIHIVDLAIGHIAALSKLMQKCGIAIYNLGTGRGYSVGEVIKTFETCSGARIPYEVVGRRAGDIASCYADACRAENELGWMARRSLQDMCADTWRWQSMNPNGYGNPIIPCRS